MADIVATRQEPGELPYYELNDKELSLSASLGNTRGWIVTGADGRILSLFSTDVGRRVFGPLMVRYASRGVTEDGQAAELPLTADRPGLFQIHPTHLSHQFELPGKIRVQERVCVPLGPPGSEQDVCAACYEVELVNQSPQRRDLRIYAIAALSGRRRWAECEAYFDKDTGAIFSNDVRYNDGCCVLTTTTTVSGHALLDDPGTLYDPQMLPRLNGPDSGRGAQFACLSVTAALEPEESSHFAFLLAFDPRGPEAAASLAHRLRNLDPVLRRSREYYKDRLDQCQVFTPDSVVNEGVLWAKVNMLRVLANYPRGLAFTNVPGGSSNVVARDMAWFIYGCDHFLPDVSRQLLGALVQSQDDSGKIPEYYNAITGATQDYGLNINDGTPLFILAVNHHTRSTGDLNYLGQIYARVKKAAEYILSQRDQRGLVFCTSTEREERGIASWRNVIPGYQISGAVTELNVECIAALRAIAHLARNLNQPQAESDRFHASAEALNRAIHEHLFDPQRGVYLLNIDPQGKRHTDVTADELFPVLFRVCDDAMACRIIRRLTNPDFWTPAGLRTVSRMDPRYEPTREVGLMGGVWPGVTWWFAFAAARHHPELMVDALRRSFEHYKRNPRAFHTVPGQFSEWFDGESLINRGMRLSPWEAPRFLWAAVEGVAGLMVSPGRPRLNPIRPADWWWTGVRKLWYHGRPVSFLEVRAGEKLRIYTTVDFDTDAEMHLFDEDVTERVHVEHPSLHVFAFARPDGFQIGIGSSHREAVTTSIGLAALLNPDTTYDYQLYDGEYDQWTDRRREKGDRLRTLGLRVAAQAYRLLSFQPRGG